MIWKKPFTQFHQQKQFTWWNCIKNNGKKWIVWFESSNMNPNALMSFKLCPCLLFAHQILDFVLWFEWKKNVDTQSMGWDIAMLQSK